jgi:hypothetical protein
MGIERRRGGGAQLMVVHEGEKGRRRYGCGLLHGYMQLKRNKME